MHFLRTGKLLLLAVLFYASSSAANEIPGANQAGTFKTVNGEVSVTREGQLITARPGDIVMAGDIITTRPNSFAGITLLDNTRLTAGPGSTLEIEDFAFDTTTHDGELSARINKGSLAVISGQLAKANPEKVVFNTNTMTIGVRGTEFIIEAGKE